MKEKIKLRFIGKADDGKPVFELTNLSEKKKQELELLRQGYKDIDFSKKNFYLTMSCFNCKHRIENQFKCTKKDKLPKSLHCRKWKYEYRSDFK